LKQVRQIVCDPPVPRSLKKAQPVFVQTIEVRDGTSGLGELTWTHLPGQVGVYQLLHVEVVKKHRRAGFGATLLDTAFIEIGRHARVAGEAARRLVVLVNQPDVILRAWLAQKGGFVHVHTLENVDINDDVMVMQRTFD
jgi:hypothetical protein